jgi:hypothetical protein
MILSYNIILYGKPTENIHTDSISMLNREKLEKLKGQDESFNGAITRLLENVKGSR